MHIYPFACIPPFIKVTIHCVILNHHLIHIHHHRFELVVYATDSPVLCHVHHSLIFVHFEILELPPSTSFELQTCHLSLLKVDLQVQLSLLDLEVNIPVHES